MLCFLILEVLTKDLFIAGLLCLFSYHKKYLAGRNSITSNLHVENLDSETSRTMHCLSQVLCYILETCLYVQRHFGVIMSLSKGNHITLTCE